MTVKFIFFLYITLYILPKYLEKKRVDSGKNESKMESCRFWQKNDKNAKKKRVQNTILAAVDKTDTLGNIHNHHL